MCLWRHFRGALAELAHGSAALLIVASLAACSGASEHPGFIGSTSGEGNTDAKSSGSTPGVAAGSRDDSCATIGPTAQPSHRPIDVIFVVDNSPSMSDEIAEIEARINRDFAGIIAASGLDYRVVLVSRYGKAGSAVGNSANPICVQAP